MNQSPLIFPSSLNNILLQQRVKIYRLVIVGACFDLVQLVRFHHWFLATARLCDKLFEYYNQRHELYDVQLVAD